MSSDVRLSLLDGLFVPHELLRVLGKRRNPLYVVRQAPVETGGRPTLAVAERFAGTAKVDPDGEELAHDARRIATLAGPNLARVREVTTRGDDLVVFGEFVEGEKLQEMWRPEKLPLEIALRLIVDALAGLGALHTLRDAQRQPMKLAHGELSPATIVLGLDGLARVLCAVSRRAPGVEAEEGSLAYLAPEVASGEPYDARADVFGAGVLLWEALSGKRLFTELTPPANAKRVRAGALPPPTVPDKAPWAKGLVAVAVRALASAPDDRWPTAAIMAAELRRAAGLKLAPASTAAAFARSAFGERVKARRESMEAGSPPAAAPAKPAAVAAAVPVAVLPVAVLPVAVLPVAAPPRAPTPLPEPSFVADIELESLRDVAPVAPAIRMTASEVVEVELASDSLIDAHSDISPIAVGPAPRPDPTRAREAPVSATRRRKNVWLAAGAALGVVVCVLAGMHLARRGPDASPSPQGPAVTAPGEGLAATTATPAPPLPTPSAPSPSPAPSDRVPAPNAPAPPAAETPVPTPVAPAVRPSVAATASPPWPQATQPPAAAVKPRPKPTFDPNSL